MASGRDSTPEKEEQKAKKAKIDKCSEFQRVVLNPADCNLDFDIEARGLRGLALCTDGFAYCWSGARANIGITGGKYCFGCKIISEQLVDMKDTPLDQQHVGRIGISRGDDSVGNLGETEHSFGFGGTGKFSNAGTFSDYGSSFGIGDTIVCAVDLDCKPLASIGFYKNGKWLGIAKHFDAGPKGLGVVNSLPRKLSWESALFPHVLLKNIVVQLQFSMEDGLVVADGYKPWSSAVEDGNALVGPSFDNSKECEIVMMIGLPASGKTTWAEKWIKDHPEKRFVLLGTNLALDQMKVPGLLRKHNYGERFDRLMDRATGIFNTLLSRASKTPRNYILDQTNVYKSARKRKLKAFLNWYKIAVVIFPTPEELKIRTAKRVKEMGKEVPQEAVNEMLANYALPRTKDTTKEEDIFDQVIFPELDRIESQRYLDEMKSSLKSVTKLGSKGDFSSYSLGCSLQSSPQPKSPEVGVMSGGIGILRDSVASLSYPDYYSPGSQIRPQYQESLLYGRHELSPPTAFHSQPKDAQHGSHFTYNNRCERNDFSYTRPISSLAHNRDAGNFIPGEHNQISPSSTTGYNFQSPQSSYFIPREHSPIPPNFSSGHEFRSPQISSLTRSGNHFADSRFHSSEMHTRGFSNEFQAPFSAATYGSPGAFPRPPPPHAYSSINPPYYQGSRPAGRGGY